MGRSWRNAGFSVAMFDYHRVTGKSLLVENGKVMYENEDVTSKLWKIMGLVLIILKGKAAMHAASQRCSRT